MPLRRILLLFLGGGILLLAAVGRWNATTPRASAAFAPHTLVGATDQQIGDYAIAYTAAKFQVVSATPQVAVARSVKAADIPGLAIGGTFSFPTIEPPLELVVLNGNFDASNLFRQLDPSMWHSNVAYILYVFDLNAGWPALTTTSWRGGSFRTVLNNPSLPDDTPLVTPVSGGIPAVPVPTPKPSSHVGAYGEVAPTVAPPIQH